MKIGIISHKNPALLQAILKLQQEECENHRELEVEIIEPGDVEKVKELRRVLVIEPTIDPLEALKDWPVPTAERDTEYRGRRRGQKNHRRRHW